MKTTFRSALLAKEHEKCLKLIDIINKSETRVDYYKKHLDIFEKCPPYKWRDYYPFGMPDRDELAHKYDISCKAYKRLTESYEKSVLKITYFATK